MLWLKSTVTFKEQTRTPLKLTIKKIWCRQKRNTFCTIPADFNTRRYEVDKTRHISTKNSKIKTFVVNSVVESNSKRFRNTALRENFDPTPDPQMKQNQCNNRRNLLYKYKEIKEKLYQNSFVYVWTTFERQVQDIYASQKVQVFSIFPRPEMSMFPNQTRPPMSMCNNRTNNIVQNTRIREHEMEYQKTVNTEKFGKRTSWFSEVINYLTTTCGRARLEDAQTEELKLHWVDKSLNCASDWTPCCALPSLNFWFTMVCVTF